MKASDVTATWLRRQVAEYSVRHKEIQAALGFSDVSMVSKMIRGDRKIQKEEAELLIEFFERRASGLAPLAPVEHEDTAHLPLYDASRPLGEAGGIESLPTGAQVPFRRQYLEAHMGATSPPDLVLIEVPGDAMAPLIPHGAIVMIDTRNRAPTGSVMAYRFDRHVFLGRIMRVPQGFRVSTDHPPAAPDHIVGADDSAFEILGRVCWVGRLT